MKTTKIIAAVLAVFLVAVLFMGAAAAAPVAGSTVYVYQYNATGDVTPTTYYLYEGGFVSGSIETDATGTFTVEGIKEGLYGNATTFAGSALFNLKYPAPVLKAVLNSTTTSIEGKSLLETQTIDFSVSNVNTTTLNYKLVFVSAVGGSTSTFDNRIFADSSVFPAAQLLNVSVKNDKAGEWSVKAVLLDGNTTGKIAANTPSKYSVSPVIKFTIGATFEKSISASKDSIVRGNSILLTVTGEPNTNVVVNVTGDGFNNFAGQSDMTPLTFDTKGYLESFNVKLNSFGTKTVQLDTNGTSADKTYTFKAQLKTVKVTINKGIVTASAEEASYYLGNTIKLSGTNTESSNVYLYIKGSNKKLTYIDTVTVQNDHSWSKSFSLANEYDAGTYTLYAAAQKFIGTSGINLTIDDDTDTYASFSLALKQPFLTATAESSVVAAGDDIVITGTAESASTLRYYVFGTNLFKTNTISPEDDGSYSQKISTTGFGAGQYFVVIQHPMYDAKFNIGPIAVDATKGNYDIKMQENSTLGDYTVNGSTLFNTLSRQSANAAEALCQALDSQNIDDIYVKLQFIVATPSLTMNPVSDVAKGSSLKVSGTSNLKAGTVISVDVLSTAFTAIEKTSVNSASFITLTTKVVKGTDGVNTWEVTFDTSGLNVDSYTIQAVSGDLSTSTIIKVVEAAKPTATATAVPTGTATAAPTATPTKTPGFGAFLALAGLGAVAVLVLRRD